MRVVYWVDEQFHAAAVRVGDWALRKPHRPFIVMAVASGFVAVCVGGMLELVELAAGRK